jgi:hypothetical protein
VQAASGIILFSAEATTIAPNPAFLFKMVLLVVGLANVIAFHAWHRVAALAVDDRPGGPRLHAMMSLGVWILVLLGGRAIAYL